MQILTPVLPKHLYSFIVNQVRPNSSHMAPLIPIHSRSARKYAFYIFLFAVCFHSILIILHLRFYLNARREFRMTQSRETNIAKALISNSKLDKSFVYSSARNKSVIRSDEGTPEKIINGSSVQLNGFSFCHMLNNATFRTDVKIS